MVKRPTLGIRKRAIAIKFQNEPPEPSVTDYKDGVKSKVPDFDFEKREHIPLTL
jgi:hypothetical protein